MGKKGLSREEKLQKIQELLHESKTAMTLKELEQKCYKEKGIVANTVKDIAAELVADNLICCEKIGLSNYYWSFPSQALVVRRQRQESMQEAITSKKRRRDDLESEREKLESERQSEDRQEKLRKLAALREEEEKLDAVLLGLQQNDPELLEALRMDIKEAREAVERWTDNLFTAKKVFKDFTNQDDEQFDMMFETQGIDYIEE